MFTFILKAFVAVLVITDPLGNTPIFASLLNPYSPFERRIIIRRACIAAVVILIVFTLMGSVIFKMFGITIGAFRIAGGVILFGIAMNMLTAQKSRVRITPGEQAEAQQKEDIAIVPLAIPLISGPGAIATVMTLETQSESYFETGIILLAILTSGIISYITYNYASTFVTKIGETGINILTRLLGLILAAMAVQFVVNGIRDSFPEIFY
jgi:multiple antibiotic resistance protein